MATSDGAFEARATVVGLGLIGSSLGLALRAGGWHVAGHDLDEARAGRALEIGAIDALGIDVDAMIAFVATPVDAIGAVIDELFASSRRPDLIVTDVGGVKAALGPAFAHPRFVGGHPMAGSEQVGPDGADVDLFAGATWVLTPTEHTDPEAFGVVRSIVVGFGADVVALDPTRHDALVAIVSHVPHLAAANLMALAADASVEHAVLLRLAAGGFRDMTRIAAGDPAIWPDIFRDNATAVLEVLDELSKRLVEARRIVADGDRDALVELLERAKVARRNLPSRIAAPDTLVECRIPVPDRPGVLAEVTTVLGGLGVNIADLEIAHSTEGSQGVIVLSIDADAAKTAREALVALGYRPSVRRIG